MKPDKQLMRIEAFSAFKSFGIKWDSFNNDLHWRVEGIDFYPTTHKWIDGRRDFRSFGVKELIEYIRARQFKKEVGVRDLTIQDLLKIASKVEEPRSLFDICEAIHDAIYGRKNISQSTGHQKGVNENGNQERREASETPAPDVS